MTKSLYNFDVFLLLIVQIMGRQSALMARELGADKRSIQIRDSFEICLRAGYHVR